MPAARSFRRVCRAWQRRAVALRCCVRWMIRLAFSSSRVRAPRLRPHDSTKALNAVLTWHAVSSGFFPPPALTHLHTEQVGQRHQPLVADHAHVTASLEVVEAQFRLLVL